MAEDLEKTSRDPSIYIGKQAIQRYNEIKEAGLLLYECVVGSTAYGTNLPTSDIDKKFIYIETLDNVLAGNATKQLNITDDYVGYELERYLELLRTQNPNIIELINTDKQHIEFCHPLFRDIVIANRDSFLSNKVAFSFGEYAKAQIKKAQGTNKKFMNPMEGPRKTLLEFGWVPYMGGVMSIVDWLANRGVSEKNCGLVALDHIRYTYALYNKMSGDQAGKTLIPEFRAQWKNSYTMYYWWKAFNPKKVDEMRKRYHELYMEKVPGILYKENKYAGILSDDGVQVRLSSIPKDEECVAYVHFNMDGWQKYCDDYNSYQQWKKNRNEQRFVDNQTADKQYDCYLDSETEYLTKTGWKRYDDIKDDELLITIDKNGNKILSPILDRIKKKYSGTIHSYQNAYTKFSVTPNHNLFLSRATRGKAGNYGVERKMNNPEFVTAENYFAGKYSHYCFFNAANINNIDLLDIEDDYLKLMGMFLSDGTLIFDKNDNPLCVSIGQSEGGKICEYIKNIGYSYTTCSSIRDGKTKREYQYLFYGTPDNKIPLYIYNACGHGSYNKTLPFWVNNLSRRQLDILIEYMFHGDGFISEKGYKVYYTVSKELADLLQAACLCNGITTKIMGPYTNNTEWGKVTLYHVYFPTNEFNVNWLNKKASGIKNKSGWTTRDVIEEYISCFTTTSNLLITRNDNKISVQGNTKNMMHCHRLLDMCIEILEGKGVKVLRPNREELLDIRLGKNTYQELVTLADEKYAKIQQLYKITSLPDKCEKRVTDGILLKFRKKFYGL